METKLIEIKAAIAAMLSMVGMFLGWRGVLTIVWLAAMILDYISGSAAAMKNGEWSSRVAREGIMHKCGMMFVVLVAVMADAVLGIMSAKVPGIEISWPYAIWPTVIVWYVLTEAGSVLENAGKMGAPIPQWLTKMLAETFKKIDK